MQLKPRQALFCRGFSDEKRPYSPLYRRPGMFTNVRLIAIISRDKEIMQSTESGSERQNIHLEERFEGN